VTRSVTRAEPRVDPALLDALLKRHEPVAIDDLAARFNRPPGAIADALDELRRAGCRLEDEGPGVVRLVSAGLSVWLDYLQHLFGKSRPIHVYQQTRSTQDVARQLVRARREAARGAVVVADEQSAGRGRFGRGWQAPAGSALMLSYVSDVEPGSASSTIDRLTFATSVALIDVLDAWLRPLGWEVKIRWPNDLYIDGAKLGGILVETVPRGDRRAAIIGIGLNVALTDDALAQARAACDRPLTSVHACGSTVTRLALLSGIIATLDRHLQTTTFHGMLDRWRRRCDLIDRHVTLCCAGQRVEGTVVDLEPHAGLILRTPQGALTHVPAASTTLL